MLDATLNCTCRTNMLILGYLKPGVYYAKAHQLLKTCFLITVMPTTQIAQE